RSSFSAFWVVGGDLSNLQNPRAATFPALGPAFVGFFLELPAAAKCGLGGDVYCPAPGSPLISLDREICRLLARFRCRQMNRSLGHHLITDGLFGAGFIDKQERIDAVVLLSGETVRRTGCRIGGRHAGMVRYELIEF